MKDWSMYEKFCLIFESTASAQTLIDFLVEEKPNTEDKFKILSFLGDYVREHKTQINYSKIKDVIKLIVFIADFPDLEVDPDYCGFRNLRIAKDVIEDESGIEIVESKYCELFINNLLILARSRIYNFG